MGYVGIIRTKNTNYLSGQNFSWLWLTTLLAEMMACHHVTLSSTPQFYCLLHPDKRRFVASTKFKSLRRPSHPPLTLSSIWQGYFWSTNYPHGIRAFSPSISTLALWRPDAKLTRVDLPHHIFPCLWVGSASEPPNSNQIQRWQSGRLANFWATAWIFSRFF